MENKYKVTRTTKDYINGQQRWDCAFKFLLECADEAGECQKKMESLTTKEINNGSSSICEGINNKSATKADN
jgi:hypothetical protein